jgi:hypothetical protein
LIHLQLLEGNSSVLKLWEYPHFPIDFTWCLLLSVSFLFLHLTQYVIYRRAIKAQVAFLLQFFGMRDMCRNECCGGMSYLTVMDFELLWLLLLFSLY